MEAARVLQRCLGSRLWYLVSAAGLLAYVALAWTHTDNLGKYDDYGDAFGFFKQLALANSPWERLQAFLVPTNEHITFTNHLAYWLQWAITGQLDFFSLTLLGHAIVIATGLLAAASLAPASHRPFVQAVLLTGYVTLLYWDSTFKTMTALSNQLVVLLALASLHLLSRTRLASAAACAWLATLTQGNGLLVWPSGLVLLLLAPEWQARRQRALAGWLAQLLLAAGVYLAIQRHLGPPPLFTASTWLARALENPWLPLQAIPAFLGSTAFAGVWPALLVGLAATVIHLDNLLAVVRGAATTPVARRMAWLAVFLLLTAITVAGLRAVVAQDAAIALSSRYRMYSVLFVLGALVLLLQRWQRSGPQAVIAVLLASMAGSLVMAGVRELPAIRQQHQWFADSFRYWLVDGDFRRGALFFPHNTDHYLFAAYYLGVYDPLVLAPPTQVLALDSGEAGSAQAVCRTPVTAAGCTVRVSHRGNAVALPVALEVDNAASTAAWRLQLCAGEQPAGAASLPAGLPPASEWLLRESQLPAGDYRAVVLRDDSPLCEHPFSKKPRKVDAEMRGLFGPR